MITRIKKLLRLIFTIILRVGISIVLLVFLFKHIDEENLLKIVRHCNKTILFYAFFVFVINYILCVVRWEMLLKAAKIQLPFKRVLISAAGGFFFSLFLPSTIGGDLMRSIDLAVHTKKPREVIATVLLDRLSGYIGLAIVALLAVLFGWKYIQDNQSILVSVAIINVILIAVLLVLFNKFIYAKVNQLLHSPQAGRIRESIKNIHQEIHIFRHHKNLAVNNIIISLIIQCVGPLSFCLIGLALGVKINLAYYFIFGPIISAITLLPISIGGLGLRDATTIYFFAKAGVVKDLAFAMSLVSFVFILICGSLGGLIYVLTIRHRRIQHHPPQEIHQPA